MKYSKKKKLKSFIIQILNEALNVVAQLTGCPSVMQKGLLQDPAEPGINQLEKHRPPAKHLGDRQENQNLKPALHCRNLRTVWDT